VELDLNEQVKITTKNTPDQTLFKLSIPKNYNFTEIQLLINVVNKGEISTGVELYLNCGKGNLKYPTKDEHQQVKIINWGENKAVVLRKGQELNLGDMIYVLLKIGSNTSLTFESRVVNNGTRFLQLNQMFYDYLDSQERLYILNLTDLPSFNTSIFVQLTSFSGSPQI
jgi:hypothetical protein